MKNKIIYNFYRGSLDPDGILYYCCIIAIPKKSSNVYCRIAGNHELEKVQKPRFTTMCIKDMFQFIYHAGVQETPMVVPGF